MANNSLEVLMGGLRTEGMDVQLQQQTPDGRMIPAKPAQLAALGTKARIAEQAQMIRDLTREEKLTWALARKSDGNELFRQGQYALAMQSYVDALTAADFGSRSPNNNVNQDSKAEMTPYDNIDTLVVPALLNLASCSLHLQEYRKAALFCQQILELRPHTPKALYRKGIAALREGEYREAIDLFNRACECQEAGEETSPKPDAGQKSSSQQGSAYDVFEMVPSEPEYTDAGEQNKGAAKTATRSTLLAKQDRDHLLKYLRSAKVKLQKQCEQERRQKQALRKAFASKPDTSPSPTATRRIWSNQPQTILFCFLVAILAVIVFHLLP